MFHSEYLKVTSIRIRTILKWRRDPELPYWYAAVDGRATGHGGASDAMSGIDGCPDVRPIVNQNR